MTRALILGAGGQLAEGFKRTLEAEGSAVLSFNEKECDLRQLNDATLPLDDVDVVVNCAAYTAVDAAEENEDLATEINGAAVGTLAALCKSHGTPLIHFSTDYVFDGQANSPYDVDAPYNPVNAYGRSKAEGERQLLASGADFLLIRTSWVYAPWGNNFLRTMARLMKERSDLKVVNDQRGRPTHVLNLAQRSLELFRRGERGTFHITDEGECSWFEFAQSIADVMESDCILTPCATSEFPRPAARPAYSVLSLEKANQVLGAAEPFQTWVSRALSE